MLPERGNNEKTLGTTSCILDNLNIAKTTGSDYIPARFLKDSAEVITDIILYLVNLSIAQNAFPDSLKHADVFPLFKKGDPVILGNYRPISVLPVLSKVVERLIHDKLYLYVSNDVMYEFQSGFRPNFSTESGLTLIHNKILSKFDQRCFTGAVLLDLQKAFDTVDHDILLLKLEAIGLNSDTVAWFRSYLSNRTQTVLVNNASSTSGSVKCGVPQGSILGPLLFTIYINDMKQSAPNCDLYLYADDSMLMFSHKDVNVIENTLSKEMDSVYNWLVSNRLSLHMGKTESILFGTQHMLKPKSPLNISCSDKLIKNVCQVNYLGMCLNNTLSGEAMCKKNN